MSNTNANFEMTGILLGQELRKHKTPEEKIAIIRQTMEPEVTVSHVACLHGGWKRKLLSELAYAGVPFDKEKALNA